MKSLLAAVIILLTAVIVLQVVPDTDVVPTGVRSVLDAVANIW